MPQLAEQFPLRASDEATTPETDTLGLTRWVFFVAHTVHRDHGEAIGYGVTALDELPGIALTTLLFDDVATFVADSRGVDEHLGSCECHEAGCFGIPLVPADEYAERPDRGLNGLEAQIPRGEVELLVVGGVIGDVHLAILPSDGAVALQDHGGIVVQACGTTLKERED